MTSLMPGPARTTHDAQDRSPRPVPLVPTSVVGGVLAALLPLLAAMALGVVGWFLLDAGSHGEPRDGLRVGALAWLMAHGSGVHVGGVLVSAVPLGLTLVAAWSVWRCGLRVGELVCAHGPDADGLADGSRDWTVPLAAGMFAAGYVCVAALTTTLSATAATAPSLGRVVLWSFALCSMLGLPAVAVGSGRAAVWSAWMPDHALGALSAARAVLRWWLVASLVAYLLAFLVDLSTAANITSQLHAHGGDVAVLVLVGVVLLPNAVAFSSAYLAGPGFAVGTGTTVSTTAVVLGPLPMVPYLAALPDPGAPPAWTSALLGLPPLLAAVAVARAQRRWATTSWTDGALRGCGGGLIAALVVALLTGLAGGAVGPGRMADVGPFTGQVLVHLLTSFGLGGLVGGLAMTAWQRRVAARDA
ncbi:cell division protein PerM [Nocardioides acrostichi]|uniref:Uncharacterized protein n=1 Tax=Nocardioides acrostichi TaxID=2784339 RepID=A0A930UXY6_9ACTN|nr:DUF6350 family protein [Nocardioides acrostichi]MBF4161742.1 hypothetical protein [Nocardioides acrostichi]